MFFRGMDRKTIYIILGFLVLYTLVMSGEVELMLFTLPGVILAMTFHEFAHAWMAVKLGDNTPRAQGRLTLNPASHIDPVGIILLLFVHIGWGKPVQINPRNFNSNKSRATCEALVSLAGPVMNFILAFILLIIYYAMVLFLTIDIPLVLYDIVYYAVIVNIGLGVFNLIPLPPLDGEKIFRNIMPGSVRAWLTRNTNTLQFIFLMLWITNLLSYVVNPVIDGVFWLINMVVRFVFGIFI